MKTVLSIIAVVFPLFVIAHDCPEWVEIEAARFSLLDDSWLIDEHGEQLSDDEKQRFMQELSERLDDCQRRSKIPPLAGAKIHHLCVAEGYP